MRQSKRALTWLFILTLSMVIALLLDRLAFVENAERKLVDLRVAALEPPMAQSEDIVVLAITEESLEQFPYRSPIDREFIANILKLLEQRHVKAIGLDVLLDQPTEETKDQVLKQTLLDLKTPLFVSYTNTPSVVNEKQLAYLNAFLPDRLWVAANLATDPLDGTVRWIFEGESSPGLPKGYARAIAESLGVKPPSGLLEIAWRPAPDAETRPFKVYPAHALAVLPPAWFEQKIVMIGAILSLTDRHRTPLAIYQDGENAMMPGILIQAHSLAQLLENRSPPAIRFIEKFFMCGLLALIGTAIGMAKRGLLFTMVSGVIVVVGLWLGLLLGYARIFPMLPIIVPSFGLIFALGITDMLIGRAERKQRQFVQGAFSRYVAPAVVQRLVENPDSLSISGVRQQVTFIFTDIAGFTTMSEKLSSDKLSEVLNDYLDGGCKTIFEHAGTVDKFIGDAIMAVFNAPIAQEDHAVRAVRCALALDTYAEAFRKKQNAQGIPIGVTRIGVHTGQATVGNFGSQSRMDFTALGDTVNTAARTEGVNKYFGTRICCTQEIVDLCPGMAFLPIGDVVLKGKLTAVTLYCPVSAWQASSGFAVAYLNAYKTLPNVEGDGSLDNRLNFESLHAQFPDEPLPKFHLDRMAQGFNSRRVVMEDK